MICHNSQNEIYRAPRGAGACFERVTIRLRAPVSSDQVTFRTWWNGAERRYPMARSKENPGLYEIEYALPGHPGILWYYFIIERDGRALYYGNAPDNLGGEGVLYPNEPPSYQITVYDPAYLTPHWMRDGLMYQIMVDRFRSSKPPEERIAPPGGVLHADWHEPPYLNINGKTRDNEANDFYGGDLKGIEEKLNYLKSLGVTALYLNPVFRARSNHKYDVGDYHQIDPSFGTEADFIRLCEKAKARNIRVLLDGVFSHTGDDSRYFNRRGTYDDTGAYQSLSSPYANWYAFGDWPDDYECWWGFDTLPNTREMEQDFQDFIIHDEHSVIAHWLNAGASGWRLDVADELPLPFLRMLYRRVKSLSGENAVLGEVWEDASRKEAYGELRSYCLGDTLDSCMNYPLRDALIAFMTGEGDANALARRIASQQENYPKPFFYSLMNLLGSHDKPRAINLLSGAGDMEPPREERVARALTAERYALGKKRFIAAWRFLVSLPGMPSMYYADEAGQQGMADPFCRGTYPWGREDADLIQAIRRANLYRAENDALKTGDMRLYAPSEDVCACARKIENGTDVFGDARENGLILCALNRAEADAEIALAADEYVPEDVRLRIPAMSAVYLELRGAG